MLSNSINRPNNNNNSMVKSRNFKKPSYKKKQNTNMIHPHIECIQAEIKTLAEEIESLDEIQKERELTAAEQNQKDIANACLEKYQATLTKLTDTPMVNKLRSYNDSTLSKKNEAQTLFLLQFFYIVRLGQLGLFDLIDIESPKAMLCAIIDVCDQLVGASVYHATDPSLHVKTQKRKQVFDILKKLDTSSEDVIVENISYKDIKGLIQNIWDNTLKEDQVLENAVIDKSAAKEWAVIQFENMVQNEEAKENNAADSGIVVQENDNKEEVAEQKEEQQPAKEEEREAPIIPQQQQGQQSNESVANEPSVDNEAPVVSEWDKKEISETPTVDGWDKKDVIEAPVVSEWVNTTNNRKPYKPTTKSNWKANNKSFNEPKKTENWDANEQRGWNVIDNTVKGDAWANAESSNTNDNWTSTTADATPQEQPQTDNKWPLSQPIETTDTQQVNTPPDSPKFIDTLQQESTEQMYNSETNDNWRRRGIDDIANSRGRVSSYRGNYRGSRGGKFRGGGTGIPGRGRGNSNNNRMNTRGRGRGRGRGTDLDAEQQQSTPSQ